MEIEYNITERDYNNFHKSYFINAFKKRALLIFLFPFLIAMGLAGGEPLNYKIFAISILIGILIMFSIYILVPYFIAKASLKKLGDQQGVFWLQKGTLTTTETGLDLYRKVGEQENVFEIKWININSFDSNNQCIMIRMADKKYFLVPKRFFSSEGELLDFQGIMQSEIRKARGIRNWEFAGMVNQSPVKSRKPSYYFGLLGLIPVIGVIAGFVFIFLGIKKFRDKRMVTIGITAIISSSVIYSVIIFSAKKMIKMNHQVFVMMSQSQLNSLIKNIEFYKIQNGAYPDDLHQLLNDDKQAPINDALQMSRKNSLYRYKISGNKYTLFSAGQDGIPRTNDDLFPQIIPYDTSKVGFIYPDEVRGDFR